MLLDANHCPDVVQFLFKIPGPNSERYVHIGDFWVSDSMKLDPVLIEFVGSDALGSVTRRVY
jgi:DNA ligase-1